MKKNEALETTEFGKVIHEYLPKSCPTEFKYAKGGTYNLKQWIKVQPKQARSLLACTTEKGFFWKISDMSAETKPFDGFYFRNSEAFLIIFWEKFNDVTVLEIRKLLPFFQKSITYNEATKLNERHHTRSYSE